jgi:hypothetical protein
VPTSVIPVLVGQSGVAGITHDDSAVNELTPRCRKCRETSCARVLQRREFTSKTFKERNMRMIKRRMVSLCISILGIGFIATPAYATRYTCSTTIGLLPSSTQDGSTAHVVGLSYTGCPDACLVTGYGFRRAYIEFADKDLFAMALTARMNGGTFGVTFDDGVTSKGGSSHGSYPCRIVSIF